MKKLIFIIIAVFLCSGCATAKKNYGVKKGMSKNMVQALWGEPKVIENSRNSCCTAKGEESWYYYRSYKQPKMLNKTVVFEGEKVEYVFVWK